MSVHFYSVKIKNIRKETADCVSVAFDIPLSLQPLFQYKQGQYITLRIYINGEEVRRSYSLCSSPLEAEWCVAIKKTPGGIFSTYANDQFKTGDEIEIMPPMGKFFTKLDKANRKKYIAFAAGSGITPVISIIKTVMASELSSSFTLVYGNKNRHSIIFREAIEALKNRFMERFRVIHILSREITDATINSGRINTEKCNQLFTRFADINADEFFICGPQDMTFCVKEFLEQNDVEEKKIHFELFTTADTKNVKHEQHSLSEVGDPKSKISVKHDGIAFDFELAFNNGNILDAALHHGVDLPYSCKSGVCCSCKARLILGKVEMDVNYGLEPEEVDDGFILCCQSHPLTEKVVIDFDIK